MYRVLMTLSNSSLITTSDDDALARLRDGRAGFAVCAK